LPVLFPTSDEAVLTLKKPSAVSYQQTESQNSTLGIRCLPATGYRPLARCNGQRTKDDGQNT
jgi:hypothetical protein